MAAVVSTLWYVDAPDPAAVLRNSTPDRDTAHALVTRLHPDRHVTAGGRATLAQVAAGKGPDDTEFDDNTVFVGSFPGVTVVCSRELIHRRPSAVDANWLHTLASENTYLIVSDAAGGWGSFAAWERGTLRRAFGAGAIEFYEDEGIPFLWERPYWSGEHPMRWPAGSVPHPEALPFHPRRLVEAANAAWLGFRYVGRTEGEPEPSGIDVWSFILHRPGEATPPAAPAGQQPTRSWWRRAVGL